MRTVLFFGLLLLTAGCFSNRSGSPTVSPTATAAPTLVPSVPAAAPAAEPQASPAVLPRQGCGYRTPAPLADLQNRAIAEASGLAASSRNQGVYWTLNDSGNSPSLYAFDVQGHDLGTFRVEGAENVDWEAMAVGPGKDGTPAIYIGDTGDNRGTRRESVIYRVPEPAVPLASGVQPRAKTDPAEAFRVVFPGKPRDVEALLVHPKSGEVVLVSKEYSGRAAVFRLEPPLEAGRRVALQPVGELNLQQLSPFVNAVSDGAVSPDGNRVVLRTYGAALEYELTEGEPLASFWQHTPRISQLADGPQGEGITYRPDGSALLTIGEQTPAVLYQSEFWCQENMPPR